MKKVTLIIIMMGIIFSTLPSPFASANVGTKIAAEVIESAAAQIIKDSVREFYFKEAQEQFTKAFLYEMQKLPNVPLRKQPELSVNVFDEFTEQIIATAKPVPGRNGYLQATIDVALFLTGLDLLIEIDQMLDELLIDPDAYRPLFAEYIGNMIDEATMLGYYEGIQILDPYTFFGSNSIPLAYHYPGTPYDERPKRLGNYEIRYLPHPHDGELLPAMVNVLTGQVLYWYLTSGYNEGEYEHEYYWLGLEVQKSSAGARLYPTFNQVKKSHVDFERNLDPEGFEDNLNVTTMFMSQEAMDQADIILTELTPIVSETTVTRNDYEKKVPAFPMPTPTQTEISFQFPDPAAYPDYMQEVHTPTQPKVTIGGDPFPGTETPPLPAPTPTPTPDVVVIPTPVPPIAPPSVNVDPNECGCKIPYSLGKPWLFALPFLLLISAIINYVVDLVGFVVTLPVVDAIPINNDGMAFVRTFAIGPIPIWDAVMMLVSLFMSLSIFRLVRRMF